MISNYNIHIKKKQMRELINLLNEASRGLLYRSPGDEFFQGKLETPTAVITFQNVDFFPKLGKFEDPEQFAQAIQSAEQQYSGLEWTNKPTKVGAFAVLTFAGPAKGQASYYGRFFNENLPNMAGKWKNDGIPGGWQLKKDTSLKASYYKLKPSDLFPPNSTFDSPQAILSAFESKEGVEPLVPGMQMLVLEKKLPIFAGQKNMATAIRDDLGETIGPIALIQGMNVGTGAEACRQDVLKGGTWEGSKINFPASKINGLVDSYIYTAAGIEVGLSSKGDKGATASIKNVYDGIKIARDQGNKKVLDKYADQVATIDKVFNLPAKVFPIAGGIELGVITEDQGRLILSMVKQGTQNLDQMKMSDTDRKAFMNLMAQMKPEANPRYNVGYHIMAVLARIYANKINQDPKFGEACLVFLNISPIIQLHMQIKTVGEDVAVTSFTSKYPPNFQGTVALDATKTYYATGVNGKCTFAYQGTKGISEELVPAAPEVVPERPKDNVKKYGRTFQR
jgi:hypothetical protein